MTTAPMPVQPPPGPPNPPAPPTDTRPAGLRRDSVLVGLGVALLATAIVISTVSSRKDGDLDWSNYGVGIAASVGLIVVALAARLLVKDAGAAHNLVSWPMAFGAVGAGLMVGIGLDDGDTTTYVAGAVIVVLSVAGYVAAPSAAPAVAATTGLFLLYVQGITDVLDVDDDDQFITASVAVLVFVLLVTAAAWALPPARTTVAVVVGAGAVVAYAGIMTVIGFASVLTAFAGDPFAEGRPSAGPDYDNDVYVTLALAAVLIAGWLVIGYLTDHPGFKILTVAMATTVLPAGMAVLAVEHPSRLSLAVGVVGGLVLAVVGLRSLGSRDSSSTPPSTPPSAPRSAPPAPPTYTG